jgi:hypothetical protein
MSADDPFYSPTLKSLPPRVARPGELLFEFVRASDRAPVMCELRFNGESYGWEAQFFERGGAVLQSWRVCVEGNLQLGGRSRSGRKWRASRRNVQLHRARRRLSLSLPTLSEPLCGSASNIRPALAAHDD